MGLQDISFGRVLTHLTTLYASLAAKLSQQGSDLPEEFARLNRDPVYRYLSRFRPPVAECPTLKTLRQQLTEVEGATQRLCQAYRPHRPEEAKVISDAIQTFVVAARSFTESFSPRWDDKGYFIVPVHLTAPHGHA